MSTSSHIDALLLLSNISASHPLCTDTDIVSLGLSNLLFSDADIYGASPTLSVLAGFSTEDQQPLTLTSTHCFLFWKFLDNPDFWVVDRNDNDGL